jgi:hypothetical protein
VCCPRWNPAVTRVACTAATVLGVLISTGGNADAKVQTLRVEPSQTDPSIADVHGPNIALWDPQVPDRNRLVLFIVGTGAKAVGSLPVDTTFAKWGYHAISLDYEDNVVAVACAHSKSTATFGQYRDAIVTGAPVSTLVHVTRANSILNRFQKMLIYLVRHDRHEGWGKFLKDNRPYWRHIIVAGHSQGAGHAAYIGKLFPVDRVLMFSGPQDYMDNFHRPAPWLLKKGRTPPSCYFAFLALKDPFNVHHQIADCAALMQLSKPKTLMIQPGRAIPRHTGVQIFINDIRTKNPHGSTILPRFENVWRYMLRAKMR